MPVDILEAFQAFARRKVLEIHHERLVLLTQLFRFVFIPHLALRTEILYLRMLELVCIHTRVPGTAITYNTRAPLATLAEVK